jgi:aminoglycoside phosphotransferase (APT) family kinase protein
MEFLSTHTSLPIPVVWNVWTDRHDRGGRGRCWFIMEYIAGETWETSWESMSLKEKEEAAVQMKGCIDQLRRLCQSMSSFLPTCWLTLFATAPDRGEYIGAVGFQPCLDLRISTESLGPFPNIDAFYTHLLRKVKMIAGEPKATSLFRRLTALKASRLSTVVFSHSDLAPRNILINNGKVSGIVDWEQSGWWPYWWEYAKAFYSVQLDTSGQVEWRRFVEAILEAHAEEEKIDVEIRGIEGFPF